MARADVDVAEASLETARIAHARTARRLPGKDDGGLGDVLDDVVGVGLRLANRVGTVRIRRAAFDELDGPVVDGRDLDARRIDGRLMKAEVALKLFLLLLRLLNSLLADPGPERSQDELRTSSFAGWCR